MSPRIDIEAFEDEWEDDDLPEARRRGRQLSERAQQKIREYEAGRVVAVDRGRVTVLYDGEEHEAAYGGSMRGEQVVVGDDVRVRPARHDNDVARILERLPRERVLQRTPDDDVGDEERVVVANVDQVIVVVGVDHLEGGIGFLDRVLVAASDGGIEAVVCMNKMDLDVDVGAVAERYEAIGHRVVPTSAKTGEGVDDLNWLLEGAWTAFTGQSGVGKSSLFNLLVPDAEHEVGELGRYGGRHTTVAARAYRVPGHEDAWLVDTPGVRSWGLGWLEPRDLPVHYPEFRGLGCLHDDCAHAGEDGCRIDGLTEVELSPERRASYERILGGLRAGEPS